jgi:predicted nucleic acid-binding protein
MSNPPDWLIQQALNRAPREELNDLDLGEREALELALQLGAELVLVGEIEGRRAARNAGLETSGTLGILIAAAVTGKLDLPIALDRLAGTNFYMTSALRENALNLARQKGRP